MYARGMLDYKKGSNETGGNVPIPERPFIAFPPNVVIGLTHDENGNSLLPNGNIMYQDVYRRLWKAERKTKLAIQLAIGAIIFAASSWLYNIIRTIYING